MVCSSPLPVAVSPVEPEGDGGQAPVPVLKIRGGQGTGTCPNASYDNMEDQYTFDYPANKIIETWKYTNGETGTQIYSVKYNDRGYITVFDTDYEEDGYATSEKNSFNYDSEGHMSSCSLYGVIDRIKDGERLYLDWNLKVTFDCEGTGDRHLSQA